jgi:hypothetical protein
MLYPLVLLEKQTARALRSETFAAIESGLLEYAAEK